MRLRAGSTIGLLAAPLLWTACGDDNNDKATDPLPQSGDEIQIPFGPNDRWTYRLSEVEEGARPETNAPYGPLHELSRIGSLAASSAQGVPFARLGETRGGEEMRRSIGGTRVFDGLTYTAIVDSFGDQADTTYMRQSGADLWFVVDFGTSENPIQTMIINALNQTLPWKFATFGLNAGSSWTMADLDTLVLVEGLPVDVDISLVGENLGIENVSVPAGQWPEAQSIRMVQDVGVSVEGFFRVTQHIRTDSWYVDDVGLVRQDDEGTFEGPGGSGSFATTLELTEYDVR